MSDLLHALHGHLILTRQREFDKLSSVTSKIIKKMRRTCPPCQRSSWQKVCGFFSGGVSDVFLKDTR